MDRLYEIQSCRKVQAPYSYGNIDCQSFWLNEEAYEMLEGIVNQYLAKHKPHNSASTVEMWRFREQAKQMEEEVVLSDIVCQYH